MLKSIKQGAVALALSLAVMTPVYGQDKKADVATADALTLQQLLDQVRAGRVSDNAEFKARETQFRNNRNQQNKLLSKTKSDIKREEARSERLEKDFSENELKLAELEGLLNERLGVFGELFGIVRQVAGETKAQIDESAISGELKGRAPRLEVLSKTKGLPEMAELEHLWFTLQQEMTAQGEVKRFPGEVINLDGTVRETEILRVGPFTLWPTDSLFAIRAMDAMPTSAVSRRLALATPPMTCSMAMPAS
jgi:biopolymer transport protein ExbB